MVEAPALYCKRKRLPCYDKKSGAAPLPHWQNCRRCWLLNATPQSVFPPSPGACRAWISPAKKSLIASEREEKARTKFRHLTSTRAREQFRFIDELGSKLGVTRRYGRAAPGHRVLEQVPGERGGNVSTLGALGRDGLRTGLRVPGAIDGETRLVFVEELLVPTLKRGAMVVRDNTPLHKLDAIEDALEAVGAGGLLLPPYSPDLNPIENCWAKVQALLRSLKPRTWQDLLEALVKAFSSIPQQDSLGWFQHWGYRVAPTCKPL